jgi:Xaa-Pro aminopeptidase
MRMLETTLLTGPYDWDAALLPRAEFNRRTDLVRMVLTEHGLGGLIVGGTSPEHGALSYLTGFVPKLGPALAFLPLHGEFHLLFSGGGAMVSSAQRLTFVGDVRAMRDPEKETAAWLREVGGDRFALWGDYAITQSVRHSLDRAAPASLVVLDGILDALRRRKSETEAALVRRACDILDGCVKTLRTASQGGQGVRTAALAAERAGYAAGAQDVRLLVSQRDGGMPEPLIGPNDPHADPLLACIAVRFAGYWAEGLTTITAAPSEALDRAKAGLEAILRESRPTTPPTILFSAALRTLRGAKLHPFVGSCVGNGIGLSRQEAPDFSFAELTSLEKDDICTLRAGAQTSATDVAIVSAMVRIAANGAEVLWQG